LVHVKKVEIFGFKSFGFKNTVVQFEPGLISISGPNGSGKSNILDAIIFAMGENRPKVMRVDKLRSLLHDIEGQRRGAKLARVNVTFDNSDRKIPVDSDLVDITREMDDKGENTYYLNKKQTNRSEILTLLDVANAGLNQLNAVQQGTVTRISEFSSEEKRQTIEDLVGLSSFDQKKAEAIKQLEDADVRLEIALAQMGEIKKRIDELEEERNQKLRYDMLEREINKLNAISAAARLKTIRASKSSKEQDLGATSADGGRLDQERGTIREEISKLEAEKSGFMEEANAYARAKAEIDSELSATKQDYDEINGTVVAAEKRISKISQLIPDRESSIRGLSDELKQVGSQASEIKNAIAQIRASAGRLDSALEELDGQRANVRDQQSEIAKRKNEIDDKIKSLTEKLNASRLALSKVESERDDTDKKINLTVSTRSQYKEESKKFSELLSRHERKIQNHARSVAELRSQLSALNSKRTGIQSEIEDIGQILAKSTRAAAQYETKIRVVKSIMHEDYSIAQLQDDGEKLGIDGLVYKMISWDQEYERAALAAGADWIKAFVVRDFATLLSLAEVAREKQLPKLKIIPMEAIPDFRMSLPRDRGVLGTLSDFVRSRPEHAKLRTFLFGNVVLVDSKEAAYRVSRAGYRAVTVDGELFEAKASAVVVDINSKISKLTKIITLSSSVDGLQRSITLLKKYIVKKKHGLRKVEDSIASAQDRLGLSEKEMSSTEQSLSDLRLKAADISDTLATFERRLAKYSEKKDRLETNAAREESYIESLNGRIAMVQENYADGEQSRIAHELERINERQSSLEKRRTEILAEMNRHSMKLETVNAAQTRAQSQIGDYGDEMSSLKEERAELETKIQSSAQLREEYNAKLVQLREREQELIATSGTSVSKLGEYDGRLRELNEKDRTLTGRISALERKSYSLSHDLKELGENEARLVQTLDSLGFDENVETFDVGPLLAGLQSEQRSLAELNAKAPDTYLEVSTGYRSMSTRKNTLEEERNSIVGFIEEIEKDKRQTFLDAFDKVDKEIRKIFTKMTGGNAWLELQNEDDIFSSGISYLIQFPSKPKRESTSISGGEKTLAAIVFVLALQKLEPSPFYLFDEVDAHLDAPNSKRLSNILEERAKESQFIMVSLKDSVVQKARLIYGVFPKNGVSNVVTYKDKRMPKVAT